MTAWVQGRTSWLSKPPMQSKRSAASGCTSAAVQWVYRIKQLAEVSVEIQITRLGSSYLSINAFFFFFLIVCPDRSRLSPSARCCRLLLTALWRQTSPEAGEMDGSWDSEVGEPWLRCDCLKKCNPFLFFFFFLTIRFLCVFQAIVLPVWHSVCDVYRHQSSQNHCESVWIISSELASNTSHVPVSPVTWSQQRKSKVWKRKWLHLKKKKKKQCHVNHI